jgi:type II secretory pathway pseudopilin PulG
MNKVLYLVLIGIILALLAPPVGAAMSQAQMDQRCEQAREAKLAPLRQEKIDECKAEGKMKTTECEQYYKDYGNGRRSAGGAYTPRMFINLPECIEAREMRSQVRQGTVPTVTRDSVHDSSKRDSTTNIKQREDSTTTKSRESGRESSTRDSTSKPSSR